LDVFFFFDQFPPKNTKFFGGNKWTEWLGKCWKLEISFFQIAKNFWWRKNWKKNLKIFLESEKAKKIAKK
jgi:hypothetical protein